MDPKYYDPDASTSLHALGRSLQGNYYALVEGLPGTSKAMRTKSWKSLDLCMAHVSALSSRHPDVQCVGYYQVIGDTADEKRDREVTPR